MVTCPRVLKGGIAALTRECDPVDHRSREIRRWFLEVRVWAVKGFDKTVRR
jgi:hypothetical protein